MDKHDELLKELKKFLKGIHMGANTFRVYQEKAKNKNLKDEITHSIDIFRNQDEKISSIIKQLGGKPPTSLSLSEEMASIMEKIKDIFIDDDKEVLNRTIRAIDMGIEGGSNLINSYKNEDLDKSILQDLTHMVSQYMDIKNKFEAIYKSLA